MVPPALRCGQKNKGNQLTQKMPGCLRSKLNVRLQKHGQGMTGKTGFCPNGINQGRLSWLHERGASSPTSPGSVMRGSLPAVPASRAWK